MTRLTEREWEAVLKALDRGEDEIQADEDTGYADPPSQMLKAIIRGRGKLVEARREKRI